MSGIAAGSKKKNDSLDILLWLGAFVISGVGVSWLVVTQPWSSEPGPITTVAMIPQRESTSSLPNVVPLAEPEFDAEDSLRVARLAFEAGMLLEPENFSAWSLYSEVLDNEPGHTEALQGLHSVADALVSRGVSALEQGRLDDVQSITDRILGTLPEHVDAQRLTADFDASIEAVAVAAAAEAAEAEEAAEAAEAEDALGRLLEAQASFETAIAGNYLLTPTQDSAKYYVGVMTARSPDDERTRQARQLLFEEFIGRATETIESQDTQAAQTWIEEAAALDVDSMRVSETDASLTALLIEMESLKPTPTSSLEAVEFVAASYPARAATRGIEGWVDIEFVVKLDGTTRDIVITEASHDSYFRRQAVEAAEKWRFEPRVFMGQSIEQRSFTRVRFELQ